MPGDETVGLDEQHGLLVAAETDGCKGIGIGTEEDRRPRLTCPEALEPGKPGFHLEDDVGHHQDVALAELEYLASFHLVHGLGHVQLESGCFRPGRAATAIPATAIAVRLG